jgi:transcriptional regulator with XRE-family HTH domain
VGRPQRPIPDDDHSPEAEFARALRRLRAEAGNPTYAQLQNRTGYSDTTLSAAASGRGRPSREVVQALVVALGGDPDDWDERWRALPATDAGQLPALPEPEPAAEPPACRRRWTAVVAGAVGLLAVTVAVTGFQLTGAEGAARSGQRPLPRRRPDRSR